MRALDASILFTCLLALTGCGDPPPAAPIDGTIDIDIGDEEEESWPELGLGETCNDNHDGLRLLMSYDRPRGLFFASVQNLTAQTLSTIQVRVRLSTGAILGPTAAVDLPAGANESILLSDGGRTFTTWGPRVEFTTGSP